MKIELREKEVVISGYVNAVCRDSRIMTLPDGHRFVEMVEAGVFAKAINNNKDVKLKFNHEREIGGTESGELELYEDNIGLHATARVTDAEVIEAAQSGKITGWSFGFNVLEDAWEDWTMEGVQRRHLKEIQLNEVSILAGKVPAYAGTSYEVRGEDTALQETRGFAESKIEKITLTEPDEKNSFDALEIKKRRLELKKMEE